MGRPRMCGCGGVRHCLASSHRLLKGRRNKMLNVNKWSFTKKKTVKTNKITLRF
jgi:hypothetical protein